MSYRVIIHPDLVSVCKKIRDKNPRQYEQLTKKIHFLIENPDSGKPLRHSLKGLWRVHIGHYVLIYRIETKENTIVLLKFGPHDEVY